MQSLHESDVTAGDNTLTPVNITGNVNACARADQMQKSYTKILAFLVCG